MKRNRLLLLILLSTLFAVCLLLVACVEYNAGEHNAPDTNRNEVLHIKRNRLSFAKDMTVDSRKIIEMCEISFGGENEEKKITEADLKNGTVKYEEFDVSSVGSNKRITISYSGNENYIFYDVNEYSVNFYKDEEQAELWKTVIPYAKHNDELGLAVWVNIEENNYSTDETAREQDPDGTVRFNGWYDSSANSVTGLYGLSAPFTGNERVVNLHAHYITQEQLSDMKLEYDGSGNRVFVGYTGEPIESLSVPEGVTSIKFSDVFSDINFGFKKIRIPSTAKLDVPIMYGVNTAGLTEIAVDPGNLRYASYNGALYSKDFKTLYFMPADCDRNELHVGFTELGSYSCAYWKAESVSLPETVTSLQHYCFAYSSLEKVDGLKNVRTIMAGVFYKSKVTAYNDGIASYIVFSDGMETTYSLSYIIDKTRKDYAVLSGTVSIAGDAFRGCKNLVSVDLGNSLENIGSSAFSGCSSLTSITLPSTLTYMGGNVFYGCTSLISVTGLPDVTFVDDDGKYNENTLPNYTFYHCESLCEVVLPDTVKRIGGYAFYGCAALDDLTLPDTITTIGSSAFRSSGLKSIALPESLTSLGSYAFYASALENVDFSRCTKLQTLSTYCFAASKLKEVNVPSAITSLPNYCFYNMPGLQKVSLNNVNSIGTYAFGQCTKLTEIDFGHAQTIGTRAFSSCSGLREITLPDSVTKVGGYAFASCSKLTTLNVGKGLAEFGNYTFLSDGVTFDKAEPALYSCGQLKNISVVKDNKNFSSSDGILYGRSVGGRDFGFGGVLYKLPSKYQNAEMIFPSEVRVTLPYSAQGLSSVQNIILNEGLENIGKATFYNSSQLTSLAIPSTVAAIGANILLNCAKVSDIQLHENPTYTLANGQVRKGGTLVLATNTMADVVIEDGITEIASGVFMSNKSIQSVTIPDSVEKIDEKAFNGCTRLKSITVGSGLKTLAANVFSALSSLETIEVSDANPNFKTVKNVLYSKDGKKLLLAAAYNRMTSLGEIENGVEEICDYAFSYHKTLNEAILPATMIRIGNYSFYECRNLELFYANEALEKIGERAFSFAESIDKTNSQETRFCDRLTDVLLYDNIKEIGENAFYGQYGINNAYFHMSSPDDITRITSGSKNIIYLTKGCPNGTTGTEYNTVFCYLYSAIEPTIELDGYFWFYIDDYGEPATWTNHHAKN